MLQARNSAKIHKFWKSYQLDEKQIALNEHLLVSKHKDQSLGLVGSPNRQTVLTYYPQLDPYLEKKTPPISLAVISSIIQITMLLSGIGKIYPNNSKG